LSLIACLHGVPLHHLLDRRRVRRKGLLGGGRLAAREEVLCARRAAGKGIAVHGPVDWPQAIASGHGGDCALDHLRLAERVGVHRTLPARHAPAGEIFRGGLRDPPADVGVG
jgi:hypothetical protein